MSWCFRVALTVFATLPSFFLIGGIAAADAQDDLKKSWRHFVDRCAVALTDLDEYVTTIAKGANSHNVGSTLDRNVRWAAAYTDFISLQTSAYYVSERRVQDCLLQGVLEGNRERAEALNKAFLQEIEGRPELAIAGGQMPPTSLGAGGNSGVEEGTYGYVVHGALPFDILAEVHISSWYIDVIAVRDTATK